MPEAVADIAVIGLAVMGQNLILNMNDHGFVVRNSFQFYVECRFMCLVILFVLGMCFQSNYLEGYGFFEC
jgi:hypothetical protein